MEQVLLVVHVLIAVALIVMVLIQRSDSDGFGLGSGSGGNVLSGRASANLLTRTTAILAALFIINSLVLSVMAAHRGSSSIVETIEEQEKSSDGVPSVPKAGVDEKAATKDVRKNTKEAPSVPAGDSATKNADDASADTSEEAAKPAKKPRVKPATDEATENDPNAAAQE
jgi:preprotein translocase subunit SecG